jgi:hypothetical protein
VMGEPVDSRFVLARRHRRPRYYSALPRKSSGWRGMASWVSRLPTGTRGNDRHP